MTERGGGDGTFFKMFDLSTHTLCKQNIDFIDDLILDAIKQAAANLKQQRLTRNTLFLDDSDFCSE